MSKTTLLLLIVMLGGLLQNYGKIRRWFNPLPLSVSGAATVVLYSTQWCNYCAKTRGYFAENKIGYQEIDVERTLEGRKAYQQLGANGVPIVVINNKTAIKGYAPDEIDEALRHQ